MPYQRLFSLFRSYIPQLLCLAEPGIHIIDHSIQRIRRLPPVTGDPMSSRICTGCQCCPAGRRDRRDCSQHIQSCSCSSLLKIFFYIWKFSLIQKFLCDPGIHSVNSQYQYFFVLIHFYTFFLAELNQFFCLFLFFILYLSDQLLPDLPVFFRLSQLLIIRIFIFIQRIFII